ncbi:Hypothetical_protein [Hexamita inflata]|uniref:Hypothetical_protein n=1 Tax=Hexamita inflata TaxID=28002 RepID=A0AA86UFM6_9EUKA|nr:Hypothetical protein HINF_LOCUS37591 [Hexamita inflata]
MLNQTQLEEHNTNIESKNQPEILITQAKAHLSKQPASQVISTQEAKPAPVKASKAEVTTANANKTAQDNLVDYKQLQAQPKVFENASQAQKQYFSLEMQLNHLKQLEASRKITKYRAFTCYLCQYQFATLQDLHYHFLQQYKSHPIHHFMNHYYGQITTHINELQEKLKQCYICDQCGHFTSNEGTHSSHLTNCMYQHQQLRWEVAQDNQGNQPTNQNTNQQPNSQQQGQSKYNLFNGLRRLNHPASAHCTSCMPQEHQQKHLFNGQQTRSTSQKRENNLAQGIIFSNSKLLTFLKNLREKRYRSICLGETVLQVFHKLFERQLNSKITHHHRQYVGRKSGLLSAKLQVAHMLNKQF